MSFRSIITRSFAAVLLCLVASSTSKAEVITQTFTLPLTQTNWDSSTPAFAGANPFAVQQFNGALHPQFGAPSTLSSVTLKMDYEFENTLTTRFANVSTIAVSAHGDISVSVPNVNTLTGSFDRTNSATSSAGDSFPKTQDLGTNTYADSKTATYTDLATLSKFTGNGILSVPAVATATSNFSSTSGNGFGGSRTLAAVTFTVTYTFVPEPGSFVLMGLGGLGLLVLGRKQVGLLNKKTDAVEVA